MFGSVESKPESTSWAVKLVDRLLAVASSALVAVLVASFAFFLLQVLYGGEYSFRLCWILGCFIFGVVSICHIANRGSHRFAWLLAVPLGLLALYGVTTLLHVEGASVLTSILVNVGIVIAIWWSISKLVQDTKRVDRSDDSRDGLLNERGAEEPDSTNRDARTVEARDESTDETDSLRALRGPTNWQERYFPTFVAAARGTGPFSRDVLRKSLSLPAVAREQLRKRWPLTDRPGAWIVGYSLAALLLFGVGGVLVRNENLDQRRLMFQLLCVYLASGLGLLSLVRLLGLRHFLRERQVDMPFKFVAIWLSGAVCLTIGVLALAMLLPRRNAEYGVLNLLVAPDDTRSSRFSFGHDGARQSDPLHQPNAVASVPFSPTANAPDGPQYPDGASLVPTVRLQQNGPRRLLRYDPEAEQQLVELEGQWVSVSSGGGGGGSGGGGGGGSGGGGTAGGGAGGDDGGAGSGNGQGSSSGPSTGSNKGGNQALNPIPSRNQGRLQRPQAAEAPAQLNPFPKPSTPQAPPQNSTHPSVASTVPHVGTANNPNRAEVPSSATPREENREALAKILKLLYYLFLAIVLGLVAWRFREQIKSAIVHLALRILRWWARMFGSRTAEQTLLAVLAPARPPLTFADFHDPFAWGTAAERSLRETVAYSFAALEAWARDHACPRAPNQTASEFAVQIGRQAAKLAAPTRDFANLYAAVAYADRPPKPETIVFVERLWEAFGDADAREEDPGTYLDL